ncbi:MAG: hypothetical protein AAFY00_09305, partial [Bacteroidota bacterium]
MEKLKVLLLASFFIAISCKQKAAPIEIVEKEPEKESVLDLKMKLTDKGFQIFDFVDDETKYCYIRMVSFV